MEATSSSPVPSRFSEYGQRKGESIENPLSLDFNFPKWSYYGQGSGENLIRYEYSVQPRLSTQLSGSEPGHLSADQSAPEENEGRCRTFCSVEEDCLKILALHQPVAIDLRYIISVLKINNDLERTGDLAVNIAERAAFLATQERLEIPFDFSGMAEKAQSMLKRSLDALVKMDADLAREVCASGDEVDAINRDMYIQVQEGIRKHPKRLECLVHILSVSRHLERVADLATNIAEDVIYVIKGEIVRHRTEDYDSHSHEQGENQTMLRPSKPS